MATINGIKNDGADGQNISGYLAACSLDKAVVAVECNGRILSKNLFDITIIGKDDKIEIVNFVGGG